MTPEKLLALVQAWKDGDCPPDALLDACMDFGLDVDAPLRYRGNSDESTIRSHLFHCVSYSERECCNAGYYIAGRCNEAALAEKP